MEKTKLQIKKLVKKFNDMADEASIQDEHFDTYGIEDSEVLEAKAVMNQALAIVSDLVTEIELLNSRIEKLEEEA